jgi:anti-sigma factor RsiW
MNQEEAKTLLPWFAAGALDADETRAVEAHLQASPELRQELAEFQVLQRSVEDVADDEPVFNPSLIDDAFRQIDAYEAQRPATAPPGLLITGLLNKAVEWLRETLVGGWVNAPSGARLAMVAQFALILILGGVLLTPTGPGTDGDPGFRTAARSANGADDAAGTTLVIVFQPTVTEQRMSELLADVGGEIVAGPSAGGNYTIRVKAESDADVTRALDTLRGNPDAVRFATKSE